MPFWQFFRKADMALFNLCTKIKNFGGQMYSFNASEVTPGLLAIQIQIQAVWPHPMYASSTNLSRKWGHKKFCIENICRSFKLYLTRNVRMKYEYSCILTQLTAYMLSHTLKSLAIDDAMYASESYWELCVRYRYSKVLFGKPIFQYMTKIQNLKKMCEYVNFLTFPAYF